MPKKYQWAASPIEYGSLISNWHTRLIISSNQTVSGRRYEFEPGQKRDDIALEDIQPLLELIKHQKPSCCGGMINPPPIQLFQLGEI